MTTTTSWALTGLLATALLLAVVFLTQADDRADETPIEPVATQGGAPIVVELFTSQGCSSCPPADRLLSELGKSGDVLPLSFHVDYWNYIGWTDPFSSPLWSERQQRYARALEAGRVYTPQLVVDGRDACVGSDRARVRELLADARTAPRRGRVELEVTPGEQSFDLRLRGSLTAPGEPLDLLVAIYETDLETPVKSGENARRTLHNDYVVRRLEDVGRASAATPVEARFELHLDASWRRDKLGVVAFLQDPESLVVHGAAHWAGASCRPGRLGR